MTAPLTPAPIAPGLHCFERVDPSGWGLNMHVLALPGGGLLVYGPAWLGEGTFEAIERLGAPRVLVAPNHYHHLSIRRFRERYPEALVVAGRGALPRLAKQGHEGVRGFEEAAPHLPEGARFLACEGAKSGEVWLLVPGADGPALVVGDAFFNVNRPVRGIVGVFVRVLKTTPGLCIGQTFPWLALRDRAAYVRWACAVIEEERPRTLACTHGDPVTDPGLPERLSSLVRSRLG